ncbi:Hypothetical predicted protein [Olea europaea subsp. europaea]|uniref:NYN domain-containing protein n=1 Tax=Olea europaea subsp. europaea TaxID=158383 RepID=A0A8S0V9G9_OLEEU|nr:Hypothetical predicted protein [Olea europaea subsp. europaea]
MQGPVAILYNIENCFVPRDVHPEDIGPVVILWDIENFLVSRDVRPEDIVGNIRMNLRAHPTIHGPATMLLAYKDFDAILKPIREGW